MSVLAIMYLGIPVFAVMFFIIMPAWAYIKGEKINNAGRYGSMSLALGGALFFGYTMFVAFLESGPFNKTHSGYEGFELATISIAGIVAIVIGLLWRLIAGLKKS